MKIYRKTRKNDKKPYKTVKTVRELSKAAKRKVAAMSLYITAGRERGTRQMNNISNHTSLGLIRLSRSFESFIAFCGGRLTHQYSLPAHLPQWTPEYFKRWYRYLTAYVQSVAGVSFAVSIPCTIRCKVRRLSAQVMTPYALCPTGSAFIHLFRFRED